MDWALTDAPEEEEFGIVLVEYNKLDYPLPENPATEEDSRPTVASSVTVVDLEVATRSP